MKTKMICAVLATLTMSLWCAETTDTTIFSDDFKDRAVFEKNWDFRSPTQPQEGVLFLAKNHYAPVLKTSIAGKGRITVETEIAVMDKKGFGGLNIDGILFFLRDGNAVAVFKSPLKSYHDSRLKKVPGYEDGKFYKIEITRTRTGDDYEYLYKVDGQEICTVKGQKIPVNNTIRTAKSQTDVKLKNFRLIESKPQ